MCIAVDIQNTAAAQLHSGFRIALRVEFDRINDQVTSERRSQVGTGMRNERIRTYNFPQGRVTDHRIGLTLYKIDAIMDGDLDELIDALVTADQARKLKEAKES